MRNLTLRLWLGLVLAVCVLPSMASAQAPGLVGSWRLESWTTSNGQPRCSEEEGPASGQIVYSRDGHMSAQLGCADLDVSSVSGVSAQDLARRISRRHLSYYGRYTLDRRAGTVTHHVLGSSLVSFVGTDQVRTFVFDGNDQITLSPGGNQLLVWLRNR